MPAPRPGPSRAFGPAKAPESHRKWPILGLDIGRTATAPIATVPSCIKQVRGHPSRRRVISGTNRVHRRLQTYKHVLQAKFADRNALPRCSVHVPDGHRSVRAHGGCARALPGDGSSSRVRKRVLTEYYSGRTPSRKPSPPKPGTNPSRQGIPSRLSPL